MWRDCPSQWAQGRHALKAQTGADVQELVSSAQLGASMTAAGSVPRWRMAGVVGALIS
jgi:hypothetical protein